MLDFGEIANLMLVETISMCQGLHQSPRAMRRMILQAELGYEFQLLDVG